MPPEWPGAPRRAPGCVALMHFDACQPAAGEDKMAPPASGPPLPQLQAPDRFQAWAYRIVVRAAYAEVKQRRLWNVRGSVVPDDRTDASDHAGGIADPDQLGRG